MRICRWVIFPILSSGLLLVVGLVILTYDSGFGEGGQRVRLEDEPVGPYLLRVVTSPTLPKVENYNVEVREKDANNG